MKLLRNGGAGLIALLCPIFLESSSLGLIAQLALGSNSIADKGLVTRKCCAMFRRRASRCVPCAEHRARASARNFPIRSSSSDHMSSPSFRKLFLCPLHGLLSPTTQDVLMSMTVNQQHPRANRQSQGEFTGPGHASWRDFKRLGWHRQSEHTLMYAQPSLLLSSTQREHTPSLGVVARYSHYPRPTPKQMEFFLCGASASLCSQHPR